VTHRSHAAHLILWLTLAAALSGCQSTTAEAPASTAAEPAAVPTASGVVFLDDTARSRAGITVEPVRRITRADAVDAPGIVALNETRTARIGSLTDGIVVDVNVQLGDRVRRGQQLASLHSHAVHDAWAGYRRAKADERRLVTELRYASDALARAERLIADRAISQQELQRAQANQVAAEEALDMGRTEVRRAEEELEHLGITNGDDPTGESGEQIPIRSPFAGVVLERLVTQGTAVNPGTLLFVVSDLSTIWVLAELDEAHLAGAQAGRAATIRVAAYPNDVFTGKVTYVGETVNPKTRRVTIRCEVPNADGRLKPEMYTTVQVGESDPRSILAVPSSAPQTVNGQATLFVSDAQQRFRATPVELGADRDGLVEVRRGVQEGDRVVTSGSFIVKSELLKSSDPGE
jgi:cobalt-zinc-cadmium efflux system membrane fusion protein